MSYPSCQIMENITNAVTSFLEYYAHNYEINPRSITACVWSKCHTILAYYNINVNVSTMQGLQITAGNTV